MPSDQEMLAMDLDHMARRMVTQHPLVKKLEAQIRKELASAAKQAMPKQAKPAKQAAKRREG